MSVALNMPLGMPRIIPLPMGDDDTVRRWKLISNWQYNLGSIKIFIASRFIFDGASIPKVFRSIYNPTGYLLIAALIHDYCYQYGHYMEIFIEGERPFKVIVTRSRADLMFKRIGNIEYPGHRKKTWVAYKMLQAGGYVAWNRYRKNN